MQACPCCLKSSLVSTAPLPSLRPSQTHIEANPASGVAPQMALQPTPSATAQDRTACAPAILTPLLPYTGCLTSCWCPCYGHPPSPLGESRRQAATSFQGCLPGSNLPHLHEAQGKAAKCAPKPLLPFRHFAQSLREALVPRQQLGPDAVPHEGAGRVPEVDSRVDHQESIPAQHGLPAPWPHCPPLRSPTMLQCGMSAVALAWAGSRLECTASQSAGLHGSASANSQPGIASQVHDTGGIAQRHTVKPAAELQPELIKLGVGRIMCRPCYAGGLPCRAAASAEATC